MTLRIPSARCSRCRPAGTLCLVVLATLLAMLVIAGPALALADPAGPTVESRAQTGVGSDVDPGEGSADGDPRVDSDVDPTVGGEAQPQTQQRTGPLPKTTLSVSPVSPDGDEDWYRTVPRITLVPEYPGRAFPTTFYAWGDESEEIYAGSFTAAAGSNTLNFHSEAGGLTEEERSWVFRVDTNLLAPELTEPPVPEDPNLPYLVTGTVPVGATASDDVSGIRHVAFFYFPWNESSQDWSVGGRQIGINQPVPLSGRSYGESWQTVSVPDGRYRVQAQTRDYAGNTAWSEPSFVVVDNTPPDVSFSRPAFDQAVSGNCVVAGAMLEENLLSWELEVARESGETWAVLAAGTAPGTGELHSFDTRIYPDGEYRLRLTVTDLVGLTRSAETTIRIANRPGSSPSRSS